MVRRTTGDDDITSGHRCFAVIAGGGTAGHVLPALAVADGLVAAGHRPEQIHYMGAERGIEARLVPPSGYRHTLFAVTGLTRHRSVRTLGSGLGFVMRLMRALRRARRVLRAEQARVVVSVGGYASLPAVLAARLEKIPVVVISYDQRPGRASRITARWAAASAVSFPDSVLPRAVVTGAPIRASVLGVRRARDREAARTALGIPADRFLVAVMGGSLGSGILNDAISRLVMEQSDDPGLAIHHVVGERYIDSMPAARSDDEGIVYRPVAFEERMDLVYAACDLLIARGGASTVHEVAATGTPAVLIPWEGAAEDHQRLNVQWLSERGGAVLLAESSVGGLADVITELRLSPQMRLELGVAALAAGEVHRSGALTALIESVALA